MRKALICRIPDIDQARTSSLWGKYAESYLILVDSFAKSPSITDNLTTNSWKLADKSRGANNGVGSARLSRASLRKGSYDA